MPATATNRLENKPAAADRGAAKEAPAAPAAAPAADPGGIKPFIPLIANLILMPALAYVMTAFVLVPRLAKNVGAPVEAHEAAAPADDQGGEAAHGGEAGDGAIVSGGKIKYSTPLSKKTLVNVSGTMGTRYLLAEFILVGNSPKLKEQVLKADAELRDAAASALASKTIADLEKPGIRNLVRSELITIFNSILGKGVVSEIYLTEFAIQ